LNHNSNYREKDGDKLWENNYEQNHKAVDYVYWSVLERSKKMDLIHLDLSPRTEHLQADCGSVDAFEEFYQLKGKTWPIFLFILSCFNRCSTALISIPI